MSDIERYNDSHVPQIEIERRIAKIETTTETITIQLRHIGDEQRRLNDIINKLGDIITVLNTQQVTSSATLTEVIRRTDLHADEIKELTTTQVDTGKILENLKSRLQLVLTVGGMVGGVVVTYVVSQVLK